MIGPVHYQLDAFPPEVDWARLAAAIGESSRALSSYAGLLQGMPDTDMLLASLTTHEATSSSRIEGTNITMSEALEIQAAAGGGNFSPDKKSDTEEVFNYRHALVEAARALDEERPLSLNLLRQTHELLMQGVRGKDKCPGEFRTQQNWIGKPGAALEQASYVPIDQVHLLSGLAKWESYLKKVDRKLDPLVQLAIIHAEFEALHPFADGNGRLGRMIIPLFLYQRRILRRPHFYMSKYLETNRDQYMDSLRLISKENAWTDWCEFFLQGVTTQALENQSKAQRIGQLHAKMLKQVPKITRSHHSNKLIKFLFEQPVFSSTHLYKHSQIPRPTAERFIRELRNTGILKVIREGKGRRTGMFAFSELLNIAEDKDVL